MLVIGVDKLRRMTDDPATALADLLERWREVPGGVLPEDARECGEPSTDLHFWGMQARAFDLVREVERAITLVEQKRPAPHFRRHLPAIYGAVGAYTVPFRATAAHTRHIIDQASIDALRGLADVLHTLDAVVPNSAAVREGVAAALDEVAELAADETLDRQSRAYLQALAGELRQALADVDVFGTALVRRLSVELAGVLMGQALNDQASGKNGRAKKAADIARQLYFVAATAGVTKMVDSGVDGLLGIVGGAS